MISLQMRDQGYFKILFVLFKINPGEDSYTCWAFSCATMLRTSCRIFIQQCYNHGLIDERRKRQLETYIMEEKVHCIIRNLLMMVLIPKKLHVDDESQAAYLRACVSRVRLNSKKHIYL